MRILSRWFALASAAALAISLAGCGDSSTGPAGLTFADVAASSTIVTTPSLVPTDEVHTCGVTTQGVSYCWGANFEGQLGDGTTTNRSVPTPVSVPAGVSFVKLSLAGFNTCGLTASGAAYCWGLNDLGQLGDGTTTDRTMPVPVAVPAGLSFVSLTSGGRHNCGLTASGAAYCWGRNLEGQLGDGTMTNRPNPVLVASPVSFVLLAASERSTCGVTPAGAVYCWGEGNDGELGDGTMANRPNPGPVSAPGVTFLGLDGGAEYYCGRTSTSAAYCWGRNQAGQLGDGSTTSRSTPVPVASPASVSFAQVTAGGNHSCGVTAGGAAYCWGANDKGQVGDGTTTQRLTPVGVTGGINFTKVSGGAFHTCGLAAGGSVYCWGSNTFGQLGDGTTDSRSTPVRVSP